VCVTWSLWMNISAQCNWAKGAQGLSCHIHEDERQLAFFPSLLFWMAEMFSQRRVCVCFGPACAGLGWFCVSGVLWDGGLPQRKHTLWFQPIQTQRWVNNCDDNWASLASERWCVQGSRYLLVIVHMCASKTPLFFLRTSAFCRGIKLFR